MLRATHIAIFIVVYLRYIKMKWKTLMLTCVVIVCDLTLWVEAKSTGIAGSMIVTAEGFQVNIVVY